MIVFTVDGAFEGLLCAAYDAYTLRLFPDALVRPEEPRPMASRTHAVRTEASHYERVERGLRARLSQRAFRDFQYAWLSEEPGSATALFRYMRKVFDARRSVEGDLADPDILAVGKLARKVKGEAHLLRGFVRFQKKADGVYVGTISPQYNVLPLLLGHFASRFAEQEWALYDMGRAYGVLRDAKGFHEIYLDRERAAELAKNSGRLPEKELDDSELLVQDMWKGYFKAVAIQERRNPRLQARLMPRRFWRYMTEKQC